jgi:hypothetical protein
MAISLSKIVHVLNIKVLVRWLESVFRNLTEQVGIHSCACRSLAFPISPTFILIILLSH